jgi:hypothetical protein
MVRVSVTEAASRLNVSVDSVRRRLRSGAVMGERDERGQWWLDLADNVQPEAQPPSVDQKFIVGVVTPLQRRENVNDELLDALYAQIADLRARLDSSEAERREDKEKALTERHRLLSMIESLAHQGNRN